MSNQDYFTEEFQACESDIEQLDQDGDVILAVEGQSPDTERHFLVSSKVLSLASPVFARLFAPGFLEGTRMANHNCPKIPVHEDDPAAMGILLAILHYQEPSEVISMNAESLAILAIHCDKYDCIRALRPWVSHWFSRFQSTHNTVVEYGLLLLAAHLFRSSEHFSTLSKKSQINLTPGFALEWEKIEILNTMPDHVKWDLTDRIGSLLDSLHYSIQVVEGSLRNCQKGYMIQGLVCMFCGRTHPTAAKKCHPCHNVDLYPKHCTSDYRVAEYFAALRKAEIWPSIMPFQTCSASDLAFRISCAKKDLRHSCAAGHLCPLKLELEMLEKKAYKLLDKVTGLVLYPLHQVSASSED